jgi:hypothetical protein
MDVTNIPTTPCFEDLAFELPSPSIRCNRLEDIDLSLLLAGAAVSAMDISEYDMQVFTTIQADLARTVSMAATATQDTTYLPPSTLTVDTTCSQWLSTHGSFGAMSQPQTSPSLALAQQCLGILPTTTQTTESQGACSPYSDIDSELGSDQSWTPSSTRRGSFATPHNYHEECKAEPAGAESGDDLPPECRAVSNTEWARMMTAANVDQGHYGDEAGFKLIHAQHSHYAWPLPLLTMKSSPWIRLTRTVLKHQLRKEQLDDVRKTRRRLKQQGYSRVWRSRHHHAGDC